MKFRKIATYSVASTMAALLSAPVYAQEAEAAKAPDSALGEIVVTATRRDSNLQTTPIAITAVDSKLISQSNPRNIGDLATFVPNFSAATITGFNAASFSLRGVGQNTIIVYFEPPVAVLVDDFVVPSVQTQLLDAFDVSQVEVLRGPQGTLFGKNTTGGAVTVRTVRPDLDRIGVEGRVMAGSFGTVQIRGAANVPIISDKLALRLVLGHDQSDGYYKNGACYGPVVAFVPSKFAGRSGCGDGKAIGGTSVWNGRAKLLWQPSSEFKALLQYEVLRDRSDSVPSVSETPKSNDFLFHRLNIGASNPASSDPLDNAGLTNREDQLMKMRSGQRIDVDGIYLNMDYTTDYGTFTSISGRRLQKSRLPNTYTGQSPVAADGEVLSLFDANRSDDRKTYQQEVRFASKLGGNFDFVAGGFYQNDKTSFCVAQVLGFLDLTNGPLPFGPWNQNPYLLCNAQKSSSTAAFAEGTFKITAKLTLTAGGRYTWERKTWFGREQVFIPQLGGGFDPSIRIDDALDANVFDFQAGVVQVRARANEPTWRASLGWQATDTLFAYATYSRGFKSGGFNDQIGSGAAFTDPSTGIQDTALFAQQAAATRPERADSFEAGIKAEAFDRKLRFNLTGFYVKYTDLQKQIAVPIVVGGRPLQVTRFFNAASANVKGIEAEATAIPIDGLTLRGVVGFQDGQYDKYVTVLPAGYNLATAPLDRLPKWQWTAFANYDVPLGKYKLSLTGDVNYVARNLFTQSITRREDNTFLNARTLVNASITLAEADDKYYLRVFGRNLTDQRYRTASQVVGGLWSFTQFGPPRFIGVEIGAKLGQMVN
jgi:iron complex outermembrane receptor protein